MLHNWEQVFQSKSTCDYPVQMTTHTFQDWVLNILSHVWVTGDGVQIDNWFHLQVVTIINYNTVTEFHTPQSICISLHRCITQELNHTLLIPLHCSTHKVFTSHIKSSQADLLYSSVLLVPLCSIQMNLLLLFFSYNCPQLNSVHLYSWETDNAYHVIATHYCCVTS
jgi:hypothetical protein